MSASTSNPTNNSKPAEEGANDASSAQKDQQKAAAELGEDDEFEDFPVEGTAHTPFGHEEDARVRAGQDEGQELIFWRTDWGQEDTELPGGNQHLWEESWDDDDTSEDFAAQLK